MHNDCLLAYSTEIPNRAGLLSGLVPESVRGDAVMERVTEFIETEVRPAIKVEVVSVSRLGRFVEDRQGSRRIRVEFASQVQAAAVLRAAFHLKSFNQSRKRERKQSVGLDPFLSKEELSYKLQLDEKFRAEKKKGTPRVYFRRCRLFANGVELLP